MSELRGVSPEIVATATAEFTPNERVILRGIMRKIRHEPLNAQETQKVRDLIDQPKDAVLFSDDEMAVIRKVLEREEALTWLTRNIRSFALWLMAVFGGFALFNIDIGTWIRNLLGNGGP